MNIDDILQEHGYKTLYDCPPGLFLCEGELCIKATDKSLSGHIHAFTADGEIFWADVSDDMRRNVLVQPIPFPTHFAMSLNEAGRILSSHKGDGDDLCQFLSDADGKSTISMKGTFTRDEIAAVLVFLDSARSVLRRII